MIIIMLIKAMSQRDIQKELGNIVKNLEPWIINNNGIRQLGHPSNEWIFTIVANAFVPKRR